MSAWPDNIKLAPISTWPGELTRNRRPSPFKSNLTATLKLLDRELEQLTETRAQRESLELLVAIPAGDLWRIDGRPRAHAVPEHPGVILSLDSIYGHLSYPCDTFTTWQDNVRAITLALEALRKVDRYGVTKRGEQYRGFHRSRRRGDEGHRRCCGACSSTGAARDPPRCRRRRRHLPARVACRGEAPRGGGALMLFDIVQLVALIIVALLAAALIARLVHLTRRVDELDERVAFIEPLFDIRRCRVCNCTDDVACVSGCWWAEDDLCSSCADDAAAASSLEGGQG